MKTVKFSWKSLTTFNYQLCLVGKSVIKQVWKCTMNVCIEAGCPLTLFWWDDEWERRPESKANSECIPRARNSAVYTESKEGSRHAWASAPTEALNHSRERDKGQLLLWVIGAWHIGCNPCWGWPKPGSLLRNKAHRAQVEWGQTTPFDKSQEMAGIFLSWGRCSITECMKTRQGRPRWYQTLHRLASPLWKFKKKKKRRLTSERCNL